METQPTVFVVDDDPAISRAIMGMGKLLNLRVECYDSAEDFLQACEPSRRGCLVLDIRMPGMSGLELQEKLTDRGITLPVVIISGHATVRTAVQAMKEGAITLLEKPFSMEELADYIHRAIELDAANREAARRRAETVGRLKHLTAKEREVFERIAAGQTNKQIAAQLNLSLRAVEDRRSRMMKKLAIRTAAELGVLARSVSSAVERNVGVGAIH